MGSRIQNQMIESVYQPMWNLNDWKVFGYEALLRFPDGYCNGNIEMAFNMAREDGCLYELDTRSITNAINSFPIHQLGEELLFINIYPSTLLHEEFELFIHKLLDNYPHSKGKIVFELNETKEEAYMWAIPELQKKIEILKEYGFYIALDDVGKGAATLRKIIEFSPDYIKLDRYFAKELNASKRKQHIVSLLIQYSKNKMGLILEGIEEAIDLAQAKALNVPVAQGYLLGKPTKVENIFSVICASHWQMMSSTMILLYLS